MATRDLGPAPQRARLLDRVFLGVCTATYVLLIAAVIVALKSYGT